MNELLGMMTVFNMMLGGNQKVTGPIQCEKQVSAKVEEMLLVDENGKISDNMSVEKTESSPQTYIFDYKIRDAEGNERHRLYHIATAKDCSTVEVKHM